MGLTWRASVSSNDRRGVPDCRNARIDPMLPDKSCNALQYFGHTIYQLDKRPSRSRFKARANGRSAAVARATRRR